MLENKFTDEDKEKIVEFLNFIAVKAQFNNWKTEDSVKHFKLLAHMQQVVLPKIDAHIFEMREVINTKKSSKE